MIAKLHKYIFMADACRHVRLVINDRKFPARTIFFSHTKPANSNNPRSYTIVSAPAEQAACICVLDLHGGTQHLCLL